MFEKENAAFSASIALGIGVAAVPVVVGCLCTWYRQSGEHSSQNRVTGAADIDHQQQDMSELPVSEVESLDESLQSEKMGRYNAVTTYDTNEKTDSSNQATATYTQTALQILNFSSSDKCNIYKSLTEHIRAGIFQRCCQPQAIHNQSQDNIVEVSDAQQENVLTEDPELKCALDEFETTNRFGECHYDARSSNSPEIDVQRRNQDLLETGQSFSNDEVSATQQGPCNNEDASIDTPLSTVSQNIVQPCPGEETVEELDITESDAQLEESSTVLYTIDYDTEYEVIDLFVISELSTVHYRIAASDVLMHSNTSSSDAGSYESIDIICSDTDFEDIAQLLFQYI